MDKDRIISTNTPFIVAGADKIESSRSIMKLIILLDLLDTELLNLGHSFRGEPKQFINNTQKGVTKRFGKMISDLFMIDIKQGSENLEVLQEKIDTLIDSNINIT